MRAAKGKGQSGAVHGGPKSGNASGDTAPRDRIPSSRP